jgi:HK97 family phage prohead protease
MTDRLMRAALADLEIRGDGRTVAGLAVPFDVPTDIADSQGVYSETFRRGAFARTIEQRGRRVKALAQHDRRRLPLGRAHSLREDAHGLAVELHISQTRDGDEALELVRDGALDGLSIGFRSVDGGDRWNATRTAVERVEVRLDEVSLVAFPAYDDARVMAVRTGSEGLVADISPAVDTADAPAPSVTAEARCADTENGGVAAVRNRIAVRTAIARSQGVI